MKPVRKCSLLLVVGLAPAPALAESVTQFAPIDEQGGPIGPVAATAAPAPLDPVPSAVAPPPPTAVPANPPSPPSTSEPLPYSPEPATPTAWGTAASSGGMKLGPSASNSTQLRDSVPPAQKDDDDAHYVSLSFSVARAVASLYEVTGEVALGRHFGVALLGGFGSLETKHPEYSQTVELQGRELGGQARVYLIGGFDHGLMLGGELLKIWADVSPTAVTDPSLVTINGMRYGGTAMLSGEGTLTGMAAFVGYKVIASFGLTLDAKLGWQSLTLTGTGRVSGEAPINGQNVAVSESGAIRETRGVPLFNLNLGWSI